MKDKISKMVGATEKLDIYNPVPIIKKIAEKDNDIKLKCEIFVDIECVSDEDNLFLLKFYYIIKSRKIPLNLFWEYHLTLQFNKNPDYNLNLKNVFSKNKEIIQKINEMINHLSSLTNIPLPYIPNEYVEE